MPPDKGVHVAVGTAKVFVAVGGFGVFVGALTVMDTGNVAPKGVFPSLKRHEDL